MKFWIRFEGFNSFDLNQTESDLVLEFRILPDMTISGAESIRV